MRKTAGELANKALSDTTTYDALEVAYAVTDDFFKEMYKAVENYHQHIDQDEFCVVMIIASDPLIHNLKRRKFYCWPWLPKPRPNQTVLLYNKVLDKFTKRLWVLPCAEVMAELSSSNLILDKKYQTMRDWSVAFYLGRFWEFIRYQHQITMLSQEEDMKLHPSKFHQSFKDDPDSSDSQAFDFSKIQCGQFTDSIDSLI